MRELNDFARQGYSIAKAMATSGIIYLNAKRKIRRYRTQRSLMENGERFVLDQKLSAEGGTLGDLEGPSPKGRFGGAESR